VDRDDGLRRLHAGAVLDGTGDAQRDVQLRGHRGAGLTDLELVRVVAGVDGGPGGTDGATQRVGEFLDHDELLGRADTTTAGDDHGGATQVGAVTGGLQVHGLDRGHRGGLTDGQGGHRRGFHGGGGALDGVRADGDGRHSLVHAVTGGVCATEDRVGGDRATLAALDVDDVHQHAGVQPHGQTTGDLTA